MNIPAVTASPVKLLLLDAYVLFRQALCALLGAQPWVREVLETGTVAEALKLAPAFAPDVAIVDLKLPGTSGLSAVRELPRAVPGCRVLVLTEDHEEPFVTQALEAGASGFALKTQSFTEVVRAVGRLLAGERYLADTLGAPVLPASGRRAGRPASPLAELTARERTVFEMLVAGQSNAQIATVLGISVKTVETHRTRVLRKLGVHSMAELILFAVRQGVPIVTGGDRTRAAGAPRPASALEAATPTDGAAVARAPQDLREPAA